MNVFVSVDKQYGSIENQLAIVLYSKLTIAQDTIYQIRTGKDNIWCLQWLPKGYKYIPKNFPEGSVGYIQPVSNRIRTFPTHLDTSWNLPVTRRLQPVTPDGYNPLPRQVQPVTLFPDYIYSFELIGWEGSWDLRVCSAFSSSRSDVDCSEVKNRGSFIRNPRPW